jgi:hypothetical protein
MLRSFDKVLRRMLNVLNAQTAIYDQFHSSSAGRAFFFLNQNADAHAAYYTSMYLIQDTGEALLAHLTQDFSRRPMQAYLEFWGVMQAVTIQQDAILELHQVVVGSRYRAQSGSAWNQLRQFRNTCAGHPANRTHGVQATQRAFLGRSFRSYDAIRYELWDANSRQRAHRVVDLRQWLSGYDTEAGAALADVLAAMKSRWP